VLVTARFANVASASAYKAKRRQMMWVKSDQWSEFRTGGRLKNLYFADRVTDNRTNNAQDQALKLRTEWFSTLYVP
jgi:hypothetical protein